MDSDGLESLSFSGLKTIFLFRKHRSIEYFRFLNFNGNGNVLYVDQYELALRVDDG